MITVTLNSLEDFVAELAAASELESPNGVADRIVRWQRNRTAEQKEAVSFQIDVWATAVIVRSDLDYLIEFGTTTGSDTQYNEAAGSRQADTLKQRLIDACQPLGLQVLPGKIEVY